MPQQWDDDLPPGWGSQQYSRSGRKPKGLSGVFAYLMDRVTPGGLPGLNLVKSGGTISQYWTGITPRVNPAERAPTTGGRPGPLGPPGRRRPPRGGGGRRQQRNVMTANV